MWQHSNMTNSINLIFPLFLCSHVQGSAEVGKFVEDIIVKWRLRSPTIVMGEDTGIPQLCFRHQWVLCLTSDMDSHEVTDQLANTFRKRKQDGTIFVGDKGHRELVRQLAIDVPTIFASGCPLFLPVEYKNEIKLRLDSNVIFYEGPIDGKYKFMDIFAVKNESPITLGLGIWQKSTGIDLYMSNNRWDRRRDLKRATLVNAVCYNGLGAFFIYKEKEKRCYRRNIRIPAKEQNCTIVGSGGHTQEILFYITKTLNMEIITKEVLDEHLRLLANGSWTADIGMLQRLVADIASTGMGIEFERSLAIDYLIPIERRPLTLIGANPNVNVFDVWAYVEVFGIIQWAIFLTLLINFVAITATFSIIMKDTPKQPVTGH